MKRRLLSLVLAGLLAVALISSVPAALADDTGYHTGNIAGASVNYVTVDMTSGVYADMMLANGSCTSAQAVSSMAQANGAFAAINGTYFEAYTGDLRFPWGTVMSGGKLLHTGGGVVGGFTKDGRFLLDRVSWSFTGYCNGSPVCFPWRINHPSDESSSITIFTPEYGAPVVPVDGGISVVADGTGRVIAITEESFTVPAGGLAFTFGPGEARLAERFQIGDAISYTYHISTKFTNASDWDDLLCAVGAGPSLIINGTVTADGEAEGFTEAKINTTSAARSFVGARADGQVFFGNIGSATLAEAAAVCQQLGLVNAMCLDGGGSVALYYEGAVSRGGRNVNNALGFFRSTVSGTEQGAPEDAVSTVTTESSPPTATRDTPAAITVTIDDSPVLWTDAEPFIDSNNRTMVPLRAVAEALDLTVSWDGEMREAAFTDGTRTIVFPIGFSFAMSDDGLVAMDTAAVIVNDRTYAPIRYLAEYFGYQVDWDGDTYTVRIENYCVWQQKIEKTQKRNGRQ